MSRIEIASRFIELLAGNPDGLHKRILKRKLLVGSDTTFYRVLAAARSLSINRIECRNDRYTMSLSAPLGGNGPIIPTDDDLISLVSLQKILAGMTCGILDATFEPLRQRLTEYLSKVDKKATTWPSRIKILDIHHRSIDEGVFRKILIASARRRTIRYTYSDAHGRKTDRTVSPQQIVRYKDNWYLDAWCHTGNDLRIFSLDAIFDIRNVNAKFKIVAPAQLKRVYASSYGIFSGEPVDNAVIRFTGLSARYVLRESWHPQQKLTSKGDGSVELAIPVNKPHELIREILARGSEAEVLAPQHLRDSVAGIVAETARNYR